MIIGMLRSINRWGLRHPGWYYSLPVVVWALLIAGGSLGPPSRMPPSIVNDKVSHGLLYAVFAGLMMHGWVRAARPELLLGLCVIVISAAWGMYLEVLQHMTPYRTFDLLDGLANTIGAGLGVTFWIVGAVWLSARDRRGNAGTRATRDGPASEGSAS